MSKIFTTPLNFSGTPLNLTGHELHLPTSAEGTAFIIPPAEGVAIPYVTWADFDKPAGIHLACKITSERPIELLPGFTEVGKYNVTTPLVRPSRNQCDYITQFWRKAVQFRHALIHDSINIKALQKHAGYQHLTVASSGPDTAAHYKPDPPRLATDCMIFVIMGSGPALVMHYTIMESLDYVLIPAAVPRGDGQPRPDTEVDALIPAKLIIDPNATFCHQERRPKH